MRIFLDSSVLLAACGRATGASRLLFDLAVRYHWRLIASGYVIREVQRNLAHHFGPGPQGEWTLLRAQLETVTDAFTFPWASLFSATKDKPVLFTAAATADVLLTLDRADFGSVMRSGFYGLAVMSPGEFLRRERDAGRVTF